MALIHTFSKEKPKRAREHVSLSMVMVWGCAQRLSGRSVGGDTTCLNAAFLVARLTFSISQSLGLSSTLLLLATRKEECGRSS